MSANQQHSKHEISWKDVVIWLKQAATGLMARARGAELLGVMQSLILGADPVNHAVNQVRERGFD